MHNANQYPAPHTRAFRRAAATVAMVTVALAGCTSAPKGNAENPAPTPAATQMAGLTAMSLVFTANPGGKDQIFEQPLDSPAEPPTSLTDASCNSNNPQASPDGTQLVYYSDCGNGVNQIFTFDLRQRIQTQLTGDLHVQNYDPTYVLGPGGELEIDWKRSDAAGNYGELWEMNAGGSARYNLTPGLIAAKREAWKPSAVSVTQRILTVRERQGDPNSDELYSLNTAGSGMRRLTTNNVPDWFPSVSSKNTVVFITKQDGHDVLATMDLDGKNRKVIVDMPGDSDDPSWSPDGSTVVFINNGRGKYNVYAYEVATGRQVLLYEGSKGRALAPIVVPRAAG